MDNRDYADRVKAIWPPGLQDEAVAVAGASSRGASHSTSNRGKKYPPEPTYADAVAVGRAIADAIGRDRTLT